VQGDFGPLTMYTSRRGKIVWFDRAPPLTPASPLQIMFRDRWKQIAKLWRDLTPEKRAAWKRAGINANMTITGYNLFVFFQSRLAKSYVGTIERQSGETLID